MDRKNFQHIEMFGRVVEFGKTHVELFPKDTTAGQCFAALGSAVSKLSEHATARLTGRNKANVNNQHRQAARQALYRQMMRISVTSIPK